MEQQVKRISPFDLRASVEAGILLPPIDVQSRPHCAL